MNWILMHGLFFTCTENLLFYHAHTMHNIAISWVLIIYKKRITLTWKGGPLIVCGESPSFRVPCLKLAVFMPLALPSPCTNFPTNKTIIYTQITLTVNTPAPSVRHSLWFAKLMLQTYAKVVRVVNFFQRKISTLLPPMLKGVDEVRMTITYDGL